MLMFIFFIIDPILLGIYAYLSVKYKWYWFLILVTRTIVSIFNDRYS